LGRRIATAIVVLSWLIGQRKPTRAKLSPYECGMTPVGDSRQRFSVKFYLVAMLFILFDVEAVFIYPWAIILRDLKRFGLWEMLVDRKSTRLNSSHGSISYAVFCLK